MVSEIRTWYQVQVSRLLASQVHGVKVVRASSGFRGFPHGPWFPSMGPGCESHLWAAAQLRSHPCAAWLQGLHLRPLLTKLPRWFLA